MRRIFAAFLFTAGVSLAQTQTFPSSNGAGCIGAANPGYVATATGPGANPPCSWQTVGAASVDANTLRTAAFVADTSGSPNIISGTTNTTFPASYVLGQYLVIKVANTNTGSTIINIGGSGGVGPVSLVTQSGGALAAGSIVAGGIYLTAYDGSRFQLIAGASNASGTVQSVAVTVPSWLSVAGSPVTTSGTLAITAAGGQAQGQVLATPVSGSGALGLRPLAAADIPTLNQNTTGYASALKSATTTVDIASATAPTAGQVLAAADSTHATWQALSAAGYGGTSTSAVSVGSGLKTFTTQAGLAYLTGVPIRATSAGSPTTYMQGVVSSYSGTTMVIDVAETGGVGTRADWNLSLIGLTGPAGSGGGGPVYATDTGTANHLVIAPSPAITYTAGASVLVKVANNSTGAVDINANGLGPKSITTTTGLALFTDAFKAGGVYLLVYEATSGTFQLQGSGACIQVSSGLSCGPGWITMRGTTSGYRVYNTEPVAGNDSLYIAAYEQTLVPTTGNCLKWGQSSGTPGGPVVAQTASGCVQKFFGTTAPSTVAGNQPGDFYTDTTNHQEFVCNATSGSCSSVSSSGWLLINGGGAGTVTFQVNGSSAVSGSGSTVNVACASGLTCTASNAGSVPTATLASDTAVMATRANVQAGLDSTCSPLSGSGTAYACSHPVALTGYTAGMLQVLVPDVNCTAGTINVSMDGLGNRKLFQADGTTNLTAAQCSTTTRPLMIYDGTLDGGTGAWRVQTGGSGSGAGTVYAADSGSANAITVTAAGFTFTAGSSIFIKMNASNTAATTATINGTAKNVKTMTLQDPPADALHAGGVYLFAYDGTQLQLQGAANCAMTSTGIACASVSNSSITLGGSTSGLTTFVAPAVGAGATYRLVGTSTTAANAGECMQWASLSGNLVAGTTGAACGAGGSYDPMDMSIFTKSITPAESNYAGYPLGWYTLGCGTASSAAGVPGEAGVGFSTSGTANCLLSWPAYNGGGIPLKDFASGSTPKPWTYVSKYSRAGGSAANSASDFYPILLNGGVAGAVPGTFANSFGIRWNHSTSTYQCFIRSGGTDVVATTVAGTADNAEHRFTITNGVAGTANSLSCSIDGGTVTTVTGTIPASDWYFSTGIAGISSTTEFTIYQMRLQIKGMTP